MIFELDEVRTRSGAAFSVFTPYKSAWLAKLEPRHVAPLDIGRLASRLAPSGGEAMPALEALGFERVEPPLPVGMSGGARLWQAFRKRLAGYGAHRDYPALEGTSRLSVHLRFGTVSIRELVRHARAARSAGAQAWLAELIWRDFYFAILAARPDVVDRAFRREYEALQWEDDPAAFRAWSEGRTGYPLVDAAMRELNATGAMHNRLRMVTASFLVKDLGIDWRRGERYFAAKLLDYDLAANNGGWQWSASTGCDAQPWFRIFNPVTQSRRFDPEGAYIRRWVPELARVPDAHVHAPWEMATARAAGGRMRHRPRLPGAGRAPRGSPAAYPRAIRGGEGAMSNGTVRTRAGDLLGLGAFVALCLAISAIGGWVTAQSVGTWYRTLQKPVFNPPDWMFAPVWTLLYLMIALAGWRVWRSRGLAGARAGMAAYAAQLALNLAWSFLFFGGRMIGIALAEIVLLLAAIGVNAVLFWRTDRLAGWLLAPYAAWVAFACVLNFALWRLN